MQVIYEAYSNSKDRLVVKKLLVRRQVYQHIQLPTKLPLVQIIGFISKHFSQCCTSFLTSLHRIKDGVGFEFLVGFKCKKRKQSQGAKVGTVRWMVKKLPTIILNLLLGFGSGVRTRVAMEEDYARGQYPASNVFDCSLLSVSQYMSSIIVIPRAKKSTKKQQSLFYDIANKNFS